MKNKGVGAAIIVIIIVIAVGAAGGYMVMSGDGGEEGTGENEPTGGGGGGTGGGTTEGWSALGISSIDTTIEYSYTASGVTVTVTERFRGRGLDTDTPDLRVDVTTYGATTSYILDGDTETGYVKTPMGDWTSFTDATDYNYSDEWSSYADSLVYYYNDYIQTGDLSWSYSSGGYEYSYEVTDVTENPSLSDSIFETS